MLIFGANNRLTLICYMATVDLVMPKMGESIMEATILKWHKNPGDSVKMDETLLEIATDKVDSEVPSTAAGVVEELLFKVNDVVPIGSVIAKIRTGAAAEHDSPAAAPSPSQSASTSYQSQPQPEHQYTQVQEVSSTIGHSNGQKPSMNGNRFYSPLVLNIAASEGVSMNELEKIPGTGNEGRVTKKDILQFIQNKKSGGQQQQSQPQTQERKEMIIPVNRVEPDNTPAQY